MERTFLLIHGMCCTGEIWSNFRNFYEARGIHVVTPTLRPQERVRVKPPASLAKLRLADYLADLEAEVARIQRERGHLPTIIGHSMGGLLAQLLAERNLGNAAVFISPTAPAGVRDGRLRRFWAVYLAARTLGLVPGKLYPDRRLTDRLVFNRVPREERDAQHAGMVQESRAAFSDFRTCAIDETKIKIPLLTVVAGSDRLVTPSSIRLTAQKYAAVGGVSREYPDHGHWLYAEPGWEKPAVEILEWIEAST